MQALEMVKAESDLSPSQLAQIEDSKFPLTTLERLLGAVSVREKIGLDIKNGVLYTNLEVGEVLKPLTRIVTDLASKKVTVSNLKSVKQMEAYLRKFGEDETADKEKKTKPKKRAKKAAKKKAAKRRTSATKRSAVIPDHIDYVIGDARTERIYEELKSLDLNIFQNSCGVLLRLFLEFSLVDYMRKNRIKIKYDSGKNSGKLKNLNDMLAEVIADVVAKDLSLESNFKFLRDSVKNRKSSLYVGLLHQYVHNPYYAPTAEDLRTTWDNSQPLFDAVWG